MCLDLPSKAPPVAPSSNEREHWDLPLSEDDISACDPQTAFEDVTPSRRGIVGTFPRTGLLDSQEFLHFSGLPVIRSLDRGECPVHLRWVDSHGLLAFSR